MSSVAETIVNEVMAETNASTGGSYSESNHTVITGDSSASVQVTNTVNSSSGGGTSHTIIEKTVDGVTTREEEVKDFAPGEPVHVNVSVEAVSGGEVVGDTHDDAAHTHGEERIDRDERASSTDESASTSDESVVKSAGNFIMEAISNIVSGILSFFK